MDLNFLNFARRLHSFLSVSPLYLFLKIVFIIVIMLTNLSFSRAYLPLISLTSFILDFTVLILSSLINVFLKITFLWVGETAQCVKAPAISLPA